MKSPKVDRPMMDNPDLYLTGFIVILWLTIPFSCVIILV